MEIDVNADSKGESFFLVKLCEIYSLSIYYCCECCPPVVSRHTLVQPERSLRMQPALTSHRRSTIKVTLTFNQSQERGHTHPLPTTVQTLQSLLSLKGCIRQHVCNQMEEWNVSLGTIYSLTRTTQTMIYATASTVVNCWGCCKLIEIWFNQLHLFVVSISLSLLTSLLRS